MRAFFSILFVLLFASIYAQPLAQRNLYPYNPGYANPAATGKNACLEINATDMHQWAGIAEAPNVQSLSLQQSFTLLKNKKSGVGINLLRDSNGPSKNLGGELLYAFHTNVGRSGNTWLSFGLSGFIEQRRLDESGFTPLFDPLVSGGAAEELAWNAAAGVYLYNEKYFAGLSVYNLLPVNNELGLGYGGDRFFLSAQVGRAFSFQQYPVALETSVQTFIGQSEYQLDLNNMLCFENNLRAGITLRKYLGAFETSGQNILVYAGYDWHNWRIGYDYNFDINGTQFHHYGTHRLALGYRLCRDDFSCPAYR